MVYIGFLVGDFGDVDESFGDGKSWKIASAFELGVDAEKDIYSGSFVGMFPFFLCQSLLYLLCSSH